jgi:hypothetical protein
MVGGNPTFTYRSTGNLEASRALVNIIGVVLEMAPVEKYDAEKGTTSPSIDLALRVLEMLVTCEELGELREVRRCASGIEPRTSWSPAEGPALAGIELEYSIHDRISIAMSKHPSLFVRVCRRCVKHSRTPNGMWTLLHRLIQSR